LKKLRKHFIVLDPGTIDDWRIVNAYDNQIAEKPNARYIEVTYINTEGDRTTVKIPREDIDEAINIMRSQIVERDFDMISASHAIAVYHYSDKVSAGVVSEMAEGYKNMCQIYLYYPFEKRPSPFMEFYALQNPSKSGPFKDEDKMIDSMLKDRENWPKILH